MKYFWLTLAAAPLALIAQTNLPLPELTAPATNVHVEAVSTSKSSRERGDTQIFSDSGDFDLKNRIGVYTGHVRVIDPQMKMTCEKLTAKTSENSSRIDSIVAETNVVIEGVDDKGRPLHATSDEAIYTYKVVGSVTNETIELVGNPVVSSAMFSGTADTIVWDRINNSIHTTGQHMTIHPEATAGTNAPAATEKK
jgi:lipopolysaccharide transport protein LptA